MTVFADALRESRVAWTLRATATVAAFVLAAFAPLVFGTARLADFAGGLYLAVAAIGLAYAVGVAGLPSLAQGAFVAIGAVVGARLLEAGTPSVVAAVAGATAGAVGGWLVGVLFGRLERGSSASRPPSR